MIEVLSEKNMIALMLYLDANKDKTIVLGDVYKHIGLTPRMRDRIDTLVRDNMISIKPYGPHSKTIALTSYGELVAELLIAADKIMIQMWDE